MLSDIWTEELQEEAELINTSEPLVLFGKNEKRARIIYHEMCRRFHPDLFAYVNNKKLSDTVSAVFAEIKDKWDIWEQLTGLGKKPIMTMQSNVIRLGDDVYTLSGCVYECENMKLFRATKDGKDSYLAVARKVNIPFDITRLKKIVGETLKADQYTRFFPLIIKHGFTVPQATGNHTAILLRFGDKFEHFRSLGYLKQLGFDILHPKDIAWIWRRILTVGAVHADYRINWRFDEDYEFIQPETHGVVSLSTLSPTSGNAKKIAAKLMLDLMVKSNNATTISRHLEAVANDAGEDTHCGTILADFDYVIQRLWGERKFHNFEYPDGYK